MQYCTCSQQQIHKRGIRGRGFESQSGDANRRVDAGDIEGVFQRDGETVERAEWSASAGEVGVQKAGAGESGNEEWLGDTVGELMSYC